MAVDLCSSPNREAVNPPVTFGACSKSTALDEALIVLVNRQMVCFNDTDFLFLLLQLVQEKLNGAGTEIVIGRIEGDA